MRLTKALIIILIGLILSINSFLLPFEAKAFDADYYVDAFKALNVKDTIGISESALERVTLALVDYIDDGSGDITLTETVKGSELTFYNEKEQHHLEDIRLLAISARTFHLYANLVMAVMAVLLIIITTNETPRERLLLFLKSFKYGALFSISALSGLGALYFIDFDWAFRRFHEIFFTNDLWLLNPRTDRLIQLMPLDFFIQFTARWLITTLIINLFFVGIGFILPKIIHKKRKNDPITF